MVCFLVSGSSAISPHVAGCRHQEAAMSRCMPVWVRSCRPLLRWTPAHCVSGVWKSGYPSQSFYVTGNATGAHSQPPPAASDRPFGFAVGPDKGDVHIRGQVRLRQPGSVSEFILSRPLGSDHDQLVVRTLQRQEYHIMLVTAVGASNRAGSADGGDRAARRRPEHVVYRR